MLCTKLLLLDSIHISLLLQYNVSYGLTDLFTCRRNRRIRGLDRPYYKVVTLWSDKSCLYCRGQGTIHGSGLRGSAQGGLKRVGGTISAVY